VRIVLALCTAFLLSSCAWWNQVTGGNDSTSSNGPGRGIAGEKHCKKGDDCGADVFVKDCVITVSVDKLIVARDNKDVFITWTLKDSPGVKFAKDGIFFKPESARAAVKQFTRVESRSDDVFVWKDANTEPGTFKYGVKVIENGKACPPLDPIIINDI
jgi:hypothetical protein